MQYEILNMKSEISNMRYEIWNLNSVIWNLDSEIWNMKSEMWNLKSGIWKLKSGIWNLKSESWNLKSETRNRKHGIWNRKSEMWNLKSDTAVVVRFQQDWSTTPIFGRVKSVPNRLVWIRMVFRMLPNPYRVHGSWLRWVGGGAAPPGPWPGPLGPWSMNQEPKLPLINRTIILIVNININNSATINVKHLYRGKYGNTFKRFFCICWVIRLVILWK